MDYGYLNFSVFCCHDGRTESMFDGLQYWEQNQQLDSEECRLNPGASRNLIFLCLNNLKVKGTESTVLSYHRPDIWSFFRSQMNVTAWVGIMQIIKKRGMHRCRFYSMGQRFICMLKWVVWMYSMWFERNSTCIMLIGKLLSIAALRMGISGAHCGW